MAWLAPVGDTGWAVVKVVLARNKVNLNGRTMIVQTNEYRGVTEAAAIARVDSQIGATTVGNFSVASDWRASDSNIQITGFTTDTAARTLPTATQFRIHHGGIRNLILTTTDTNAVSTAGVATITGATMNITSATVAAPEGTAVTFLSNGNNLEMRASRDNEGAGWKVTESVKD
jgi:hypothetical protein